MSDENPPSDHSQAGTEFPLGTLGDSETPAKMGYDEIAEVSGEEYEAENDSQKEVLETTPSDIISSQSGRDDIPTGMEGTESSVGEEANGGRGEEVQADQPGQPISFVQPAPVAYGVSPVILQPPTSSPDTPPTHALSFEFRSTNGQFMFFLPREGAEGFAKEIMEAIAAIDQATNPQSQLLLPNRQRRRSIERAMKKEADPFRLPPKNFRG